MKCYVHIYFKTNILVIRICVIVTIVVTIIVIIVAITITMIRLFAYCI